MKNTDLATLTAIAGKNKSLYSYLIVLVLVTLLPVMLAGTLTMWLAGQEFRNSSERRLQDTAAMLAHAIEEEIEQHFTMLQLLSQVLSSTEITPSETGSWLAAAGFGEHSKITIETQFSMASAIPEMKQLVSQVLHTGKPGLSDLIATAEPRTMLAVAVPYQQDAQPSVLVMYAGAAELFRLHKKTTANLSELLTAITDSQGYIVARSREAERYAGRHVPDWDKLLASGNKRGVFEGSTKEGTEVIFAFSTLDNTPGWTIVAGEPLELFASHWQRPLLGIAIGGIIAAIVALLAAAELARRILSPIRALAAQSTRVVAGENISAARAAPPSTVTEFEILRRSLAQAESALHKRAADARQLASNISRSERRYRAVAEAGALVFWRSQLPGTLLAATGWEELTGQPEQEILGYSWTLRVHPAEQQQVEQHWQQCEQNNTPLDIECRIRKQDGGWHWVRARAVKLTDGTHPEWVGVLEDIESRKQAEAKITYMARHDNLTGLANRAMFQEALQNAVDEASNGASSVLLVMDLDKFKAVNDSLGHPAGDALLLAVTERLKHNCRDTDIIARQGGDEFAVLQQGTIAHAEKLAQRLIDAIKAPYTLNNQTITIGISIGIAPINQQTTEPEQVMQAADTALYQAKNRGKGCFCTYRKEDAAG